MSKYESTAGKIRRSQAVTTFGIGSIVDFPRGSFMPLGLDQQEWFYSRLPQEIKDAVTIFEPRLQHMLGVQEFRTAIIPGEGQISEYGQKVKKAWTMPSTRFPEWLECPRCHRLGKEGDPFERQPDLSIRCTAGRCGTTVNPVRFIVGCEKGHIDDFPWAIWAHTNRDKICENPRLYLKSRGRSASLGDLYVECVNDGCGGRRSLQDIFRSSDIRKLGCRGKQPWLLSSEKCSAELKTLQRGGSNVHFPIVASMLSIPPASESIAKVLERFWPMLKGIPEIALEATLRGTIEGMDLGIDVQSALGWVRRRRKIDSEGAPADEKSARLQEYEALGRDISEDDSYSLSSEFENKTFEPPEEFRGWFDLISAATRLREVRAFCGFTRITPNPTPAEKVGEAISKGSISAPYRNPVGWRPGIEVRGEGIFLRFSENKIRIWASNQAVIKRAQTINEHLQTIFEGRGLEQPHTISPRLLAVHSFAHLLVRRMSLDCGYSSASLRERLYISDGEDGSESMAGVLIYTASPDSDGSLGGLVNLATPDNIRSLLTRSVQDARWCGNDPVCLETNPRDAGDRLSGASCHSCLLVPETVCEKFNRELDRVFLVGSEEESIPGFFEGFPEPA